MPSQTRRIRLDRLPNVRPEGALLSQGFNSVQEGGKWFWQTGNGTWPIIKRGELGISNGQWADVVSMAEHPIQNDWAQSMLFMANSNGTGSSAYKQLYGYFPYNFTQKMYALSPDSYYSGNINYLKKDHFGHLGIMNDTYYERVYLGKASQAGSTILIDILDATHYKNWTALGVDVGDRVWNLKNKSWGIVTSINTNTYANDTLTFSAGLSGGNTFSTGDEYAVLTRSWAATSFGSAMTTNPFQWQIEVMADMTIFPTRTGYLARYRLEDGSDLDSVWKLLPQFQIFSCMAGNNGQLLIGTRNSNDGSGQILLWDTFSDGYNSIINTEAAVTSIKAYKTGWLVSCNGVEYYTDGYSISKVFDWGLDLRTMNNSIVTPRADGKVIRDGHIYMVVQGYSWTKTPTGILRYNLETGEYSITPFTTYPRNAFSNSVKAPATMADNNAAGTITWSDPNNAKVEDDTFANAVFSGSSTIPKMYLAKLVVGDVVVGDNKATDANLTTTNTFYTYGNDSTDWNTPLTPALVNASNFGVVIQHRSDTVYTHYLKATNFGFAIPTSAYISGVKVRVKQKYSAGGGNETSWVDYIEITIYYFDYLKIAETGDGDWYYTNLFYSNLFSYLYVAGGQQMVYRYSPIYPYYNNCVGITQAIQFPRNVTIERIHIHLAPADSPFNTFYGVSKMEVKIADGNEKIFKYGGATAILAANKIRVNGTSRPVSNQAEVGDEIFLVGNNTPSAGQRTIITQIDNIGTATEDWTLDRDFQDTPASTSYNLEIRPFKKLGEIVITPTVSSMKTQKYFFDNNAIKKMTDRIYIEILVNYIYGANYPTIRVAAIEIEYKEAERT